jgi:hypothetical protein
MKVDEIKVGETYEHTGYHPHRKVKSIYNHVWLGQKVLFESKNELGEKYTNTCLLEDFAAWAKCRVGEKDD